MFEGGIVVITAIMSIVFLGRKQFRHHFTGLVIIFLSLFILGLASLIFKGEQVRKTNLFGIGLMTLSLVCTSSQNILEEKYIREYSIHPLKVVGLEGFWGTIYYIVVLPILQFIRCETFDGVDLCTINDRSEWRVEDTIFAVRQLGHNKFLIFLVIASTVIIAAYNYYGVCVTQQVSCTQRAVADNIRMILIWVFFISVPTNITEKFIWLQLIGFILLVFGTCLYTEVIVLPFWGFDQYTEKALKEKEEKEEKESAGSSRKNTGSTEDKENPDEYDVLKESHTSSNDDKKLA